MNASTSPSPRNVTINGIEGIIWPDELAYAPAYCGVRPPDAPVVDLAKIYYNRWDYAP